MSKMNKLLAVLIALLTVFWSFNIIISAFAGATEGIIFNNRTGDISKKFPVQITPDGFTFIIWNVIFFWILAGYIFLIVNIFRETKDGLGKVFCTPEVLTLPVACVLILNNCVYTSWLFVWDSQYMTAAAAILLCIMGTNWVALALFSYRLGVNTIELSERSPWVLNCYRILLQNSFAVYTTWTTVAFLLNLTIAMTFDAGIEDKTASLVNMGILTGILAVWIPLDVFLLDKYCRYMLSPLFVVTWALIGILSRLQKVEYEDDTMKNFTVGLLGVVSVLLLSRLGLTIFRFMKRPFQP